jgi:hypothetical protein
MALAEVQVRMPENSVAARAWLRPAFCLRLVLAFVAMGSVCRVSQYLSRRSFWQDEVFLLLNLREKLPAQLFGPLDARSREPQAAPPGFLQIEKFLFDRWGPSELAMRSVAQALGLLSLPLMARVAWRLLPAAGAVCAVGLFALSDELIAHAAELKPYSGDAFFACLLVWLATRRGDDPGGGRPDARRLWAVTLAASAAVWFSYTSVFVAGGIILAMLITGRPRGMQMTWVWVLAVVPLALSVGLVYRVSVRFQQDPLLKTQWAEYLADWDHPLGLPRWAARGTFYLANSSAAGAGPMVLALSIAGGVALWRAGAMQGRRTLALLLAPIVLCFLAATVRAYPYGGARTSSFLAPLVCLLAGAGFAALVALRRHRAARATGWVLAGLSLAILLGQAGRYLFVPRVRSHMRPIVEYLREHRRPGDVVYVIGGGASEVYRCYARPIDADDALTVLDAPKDRLLPPRRGRFWLVSAGSPERLTESMKPLLAQACAVARPGESHTVRGGVAYLFERSD